MIKIRLTRVGRKNKPVFRLIVSDTRKDTKADFLEMLGNYNPHTKEINLKTDRIKHWLSKGAQASDTVHNILVSEKIIEAKKVTSSRISKKRKEKLAEKEKEAKKEEAKPTEETKEKKEEPKTEVKPEEKKEEGKPETKEEPKVEEKKEEEKAPEAKK